MPKPSAADGFATESPNMNLGLRGLTAVVTGGSSGIGSAIVRALAAEGCNVEFCGRSREKIDGTVMTSADLAGAVNGTAIDVTDLDAVNAWFDRIGVFDILIPNVSALSADWETSTSVDIRATVDATEAAVPHMQQSRHAAITYVGSKAASLAAPRSAAYGASKAAMAHYMKSLALRLLPTIRVNVVSPGDTFVEGGFWHKARQAEPLAFDAVLARNPLGRLASPEEIARVVAFISSPSASFVAGANWYVDGGSTAHVQI